MIKIFIFTFLFLSNAFSAYLPEESTSSSSYGSDFRIWIKMKKLRYLFEYNYHNDSKLPLSTNLKTGVKYHINSNYKLGLFYKRSSGLRHDDDWIEENNKWIWIDSKERFENILESQFIYKNLLTFIKNTAYQFKLSFLNNFYNEQQVIKIRPGLSYFPNNKILVFINYEIYLPLNFSETSIYEKWLYLGFFYTFSDLIKIGPYFKMGDATWTTSKQYKDKHPSEKYESTHKWKHYGLNLNLYF